MFKRYGRTHSFLPVRVVTAGSYVCGLVLMQRSTTKQNRYMQLHCICQQNKNTEHPQHGSRFLCFYSPAKSRRSTVAHLAPIAAAA
jgi:hypothetical protein